MSKQTTVVKFGETSTTSAIFELDGQSHLDKAGNERSQLYEGEEGILRLHHDPGYRVTQVVPLQGTIVEIGSATRTITGEIYFSLPKEGDADTGSGQRSLAYIPAGPVAVSWDERPGAGFGWSGRQVWVTGGYPCKGTVSYPVAFTLYRFIPPPMSLADGASMQITIEAYLEAI